MPKLKKVADILFVCYFMKHMDAGYTL